MTILGTSKFELEYCEKLIEHMALGHSYITIGVKLRVSPTTLYRWEDQYPEWKEAKEIGMMVCQYEWEEILIQASRGVIKANGAALIFALKNYFPDQFKDNQQLGADSGVTIVIDTGVPRAIDASSNVISQENVQISHQPKVTDAPQTLKGVEDVPYKSILVEESDSDLL